MIDEKAVQDIMKDTSNHYKYIVSGPKGMSQVMESFVDEARGRGELYGYHKQAFLFAEVKYKLTQNKHNEKIQLSTQVGLNSRKFGHFSDENVTCVELRQRVRFVSALATVAQLPGATMAIYYRRQTAKDRVFQIKQTPIREWLQERMAFTGDYETDYETAWMQLWFNQSAKFTEHDDTIKRISLIRYETLLSDRMPH